ncbi:transposase [Clostridium sp. MSJ-4]|uniref:Transposase n=1 Tax=Clostridium simiarum TaxID=2841506 RepID=A0ABS6F380_9CLOT|nr:transposase [Clostridium simiarum]
MKITKAINKESKKHINHKRIERIMQENGIKSKVSKKFKVTINNEII